MTTGQHIDADSSPGSPADPTVLIENRHFAAGIRISRSIKLNRGKKHVEDTVERAAAQFAVCLCEEPLYSTVEDKRSWTEAEIRKHAKLDKWRPDYGAAVQRGLKRPAFPAERSPIRLDGATVQHDLRFVLHELSQLRSGSRARPWTDRVILVGLALVCEARRAQAAGSREFFVAEHQLARLAGISHTALATAVRGWQSVLVDLTQRGGRVEGARTFRICPGLKAHLESHPTPSGGSLDLDRHGVAGLLFAAAAGSPELSIPRWEVRLELDDAGQPVLVRSDGSHRRKIELGASRPSRPSRPVPLLVQRRPVSWSAESPPSGRRVIEEIEEARPYRVRLARTGLPIDRDALACCIQEHEQELRARGIRVKTVPAGEFTDDEDPLQAWIDEKSALSELADERLMHRLGALQAIRARLHPDGRSRTIYYDGSATTNRLVSLGSAAHDAVCHQNIPKTLLERIVAAPPGQVLVTADFVSLDPMSLGEMTRDPQLLADLEGDVYSTLAASFDTDNALGACGRRLWKRAFLAWCYGAEPKRLAELFGIEPSTAAQIHRDIEARYPVATRVLAGFEDHHRRRRRTHPSICGFIRAGGRPETVGRNTPVAATSADIARRFEINVLQLAEERGVRLNPVLSIYDGVVWGVSAEHAAVAVDVVDDALRRTEQKLNLFVVLRMKHATAGRLKQAGAIPSPEASDVARAATFSRMIS